MTAEGILEDQRDLFDEWFGADHFAPQAEGFDELRQFAMQPSLWRNHAGSAPSPFPAERHTASVLARRAAAFVAARHDSDRPWFLWLSFPDPHNPYIAPEPYASLYDPQTVPLPPLDDLSKKPERQQIASRMCGMHNADEAATRKAIAIQYAQVSAVDAAVGRVLQALESAGVTEDTVVVFTTDHGGYVGEHGAWHKAPAFYECLIRIPLLVSWPGTLTPSVLSDGLIEQVDLLPTLLDLAGVPTPPGVQGRSMVAALEGTPGAARPEGFAEVGEAGTPVTWDDLPFMPDSPLDDRWYPWDGFQEAWIGRGKMVRTLEWKYAWYANGDEELYDLRADPDELSNLATSPEHEERVRAFKDRLLLWTVETEDPLPLHAGNIYLRDAVSGNMPW
jgi:arylsulfatase A-like enzyme